jgi:hypothetical protein
MEEPNPYLCQAVEEYLLWLYNCGEDMCPFMEPPVYLRQLSLETCCLLPNSSLSPGDHIRVDKRAFKKPVHVNVKLVVLGYDPGM